MWIKRVLRNGLRNIFYLEKNIYLKKKKNTKQKQQTTNNKQRHH